MPNGYAFHIGLNTVDQTHYQELKDLRGAVNDAIDYGRIARDYFGYQSSQTLLDEDATAENVLAYLNFLAENSKAGDIVFITYSGHGGQIDRPKWAEENGDERTDETWCLYDRQLIDDELFMAFKGFKKGVRIVVISDSCHSGTVARDMPERGETPTPNEPDFLNDLLANNVLESDFHEGDFLSKDFDSGIASLVYLQNLTTYESIQNQFKNLTKKDNIEASVKLFAACQDHQIAFDGAKNGRFTEAILHLIETGKWEKLNSPNEFISVLKNQFNYPNPNLFQYGKLIPSFENNFPLTINIPNAEVTTDDLVTENPEPIEVDKEKIIQPVLNLRDLLLTFENEPILRGNIMKICPEEIDNIEFEGEGVCIVEVPDNGKTIWESAHEMAKKADDLGLSVEIELATSANFPVESDVQESRAAAGDGKKYLPYWPPALNGKPDTPMGWHLDDEHTQLATAREHVWEETRKKQNKQKKEDIKPPIRIAQIDTGYLPHHPALVRHPFINKELSKSFLKLEKKSKPKAYDHNYQGDKLMQGHGTGTLGILTGWKMPASQTQGQNIGYVGAIPFAETLVLRVADSTLIFNAKNFTKALNYAVDKGCEVVTISMGGKPNKKMVKAINRAYDKGVTIVSAGGNSMVRGFNKIGPHTIVYPARYQRVMAACGACHNHWPYDFKAQERYLEEHPEEANHRGKLNVENMQGNWGPDYYMTKALATYSPNIWWLEDSDEVPLKKTGGGTSSATPQLAAAAALWIVKHREELDRRGYSGTWKQVEAVRTALFHSADKTTFKEWKKYYGNGLLRAMDAINFGVPEISDNMKSPKAKSTIAGVVELMDLFLNRIKTNDNVGSNLSETIMAEIHDLILSKTSGHDLFHEIDMEGGLDENTTQKLVELVRNSPECSEWLKRWAGSFES